MSLKAFHIFFVSVCILFLIGFGGWSIREYGRMDGTVNLIMAVGSFVLAIVLLLYGRWFARKLRSVE